MKPVLSTYFVPIEDAPENIEDLKDPKQYYDSIDTLYDAEDHYLFKLEIGEYVVDILVFKDSIEGDIVSDWLSDGTRDEKEIRRMATEMLITELFNPDDLLEFLEIEREYGEKMAMKEN